MELTPFELLDNYKLSKEEKAEEVVTKEGKSLPKDLDEVHATYLKDGELMIEYLTDQVMKTLRIPISEIPGMGVLGCASPPIGGIRYMFPDDYKDPEDFDEKYYTGEKHYSCMGYR